MGSQKKAEKWSYIEDRIKFNEQRKWDDGLARAYYSWLNDGGFAWAEDESQKWEDFIRSEEDFEDSQKSEYDE